MATNWISALLGLGGAGMQYLSEQEATAANREVADAAAGLLSGGTQGTLTYGGLSGYGTPYMSYDALGDIDTTYRGIFDLYNAHVNAGNHDFANMASGLRTATNAYANTTQNAYGNMSQNVMSEYDKGAAGTLGYAKQRLSTGLRMYDQAAQQERKDIQSQYNAAGQAAQQALASRGLGNIATVGTSVAAGNERERADALGRLNDRVTEMKAGAYQGLSGDVLSTLGQNAVNRSNLYGGLQQGQYGLTQSNADLARQMESGLVQNQYNLGQQNRSGYSDLFSNWSMNRLQSNQTAANNALNLITGTQNTYPDQSSYLQLLQGLGSGSVGTSSPNTGLFGGSGLLGLGGQAAPLAMAADYGLSTALGSVNPTGLAMTGLLFGSL
jgi:hypothetical protein